MSAVEQKKVIRERMRSQRQQLTADQHTQAANGLLQTLSGNLQSTDFPLAIYLTFDGELDTQPLIEFAWRSGHDIYLPIVQGNGVSLLFRRYDSETILERNCYGIGEPSTGELFPASAMHTICLPLTAFDRTGGRLGMGGGFYDITLAELREANQAQPKLIGLAYEFQEVSECPMEAHDQLLDFIATPRELIIL